MNLDAPSSLPAGLKNLSHSSISLYLQCPEKWRRYYVEGEYEPPKGIMVLGRAVHTAEAQSYSQMIETGEPNPMEQVLDDFVTSFAQEQAEEKAIDWQDDQPGGLKDRGVAMLGAYHKSIVPHMLPTKAEVEFNVRLRPEYDWTIKGFIDVIGGYDDGFEKHASGPHDIKTVTKANSQADVDASVQATLYTYATMQEGETEKPFRVHQLRVLAKGAQADMITTYREREAHTLYLERVAKIAREIDWRMTSGEWQGAPPSAWWCRARSCGFHPTCPMATR